MNAKQEINPQTIGVIASIIFAILAVAGFFMLWTMSKNIPEGLPIADNLKPIEIETVKKDAENVLSGLEKVSDIPISAPTEKMGKDNPFTTS